MLPSLVSPVVIAKMIKKARETPSGCFVEIGVYKGGTAWHLTKLAKEQSRPIYLYDTFEGIPYKGIMDSHKVGDFKDTSFESIKEALPYANVIKGIFPESAVDMSDISFVHFDCDQYQSIIDGVNYILPKMLKNGILWFDDYGALKGATQAVRELFPGKYIKTIYGKAYVIV